MRDQCEYPRLLKKGTVLQNNSYYGNSSIVEMDDVELPVVMVARDFLVNAGDDPFPVFLVDGTETLRHAKYWVQASPEVIIEFHLRFVHTAS
jgi:hypothetical protein